MRKLRNNTSLVANIFLHGFPRIRKIRCRDFSVILKGKVSITGTLKNAGQIQQVDFVEIKISFVKVTVIIFKKFIKRYIEYFFWQ